MAKYGMGSTVYGGKKNEQKSKRFAGNFRRQIGDISGGGGEETIIIIKAVIVSVLCPQMPILQRFIACAFHTDAWIIYGMPLFVLKKRTLIYGAIVEIVDMLYVLCCTCALNTL